MSFKPMKRSLAFLLVLIVVSTLILPIHQHSAFSQDPTASQKVESDDARVDRNGTWTSQSASGASGGNYLYGGGNENDALSLRFYGSSLEVIYVSGPSLGTLAIEVDGTVLRTVISAADSTNYGKSAKISYLSAEEWHVVRVYAQEGGTVAIDAFVANLDAPPPTFVEPSDNPDRPAGSATGADTPVSDTPVVVEDTVHRAPRLAELGHIIINEVDPGTSDAIELFNPTTAPVALTNFQIRTYLNNALENTFTFPAFVIYPGAYLVIYEGTGTPNGNTLYLGYSTGMEMDFNVAVSLTNASNQGVDFVRWGGSTINPSAPDTWTGSPTFTYNSAQSIGRVEQNDDDDVSSDWFAQCPTLGKANNACLVLNEFYTGDVDAVEIFNPTNRTITLTGYQFTSYSGVSTTDGTYTFPTASIPAGGYVVVYEDTGTNTATTFYSGFNYAWNADDGAGMLTTGVGGSVVDFARWGTTTVAPAGTNWFGGVLPSAASDLTSQQRRPSSEDGDRTSDFCANLPSLGTVNRSCVVINEINGGDFDNVELYNASLAAYTLTGFNILVYDWNGSLAINYVFPTFTLAAGAYVRILEGAGTNTSTALYTGGSLGWVPGDPGAVQLFNEVSNGVDFVRWGTNDTLGLNGANMMSPNPPGFPPNVNTTTIGRNTSGGDFDEGADWCYQPTTPSARNYGCNARIALFAPSVNYIGLVDSTANPPAPNAYNMFASGLPAAGTNGQWVMGDWDGDGRDTPGVYAPNGVFYFTNQSGPIRSADWNGIWFGLLGGVVPNAPVAGRFNGAVQNDCIGVIDSANFPPYGVAFVLYFTCDMSGGNPPKTFQWLSVILPDSQGHSGPFQFGAGNYDSNGIDSIAIRRGNYIAFSLTNPTTTNATFPLAQYFGAPEGGTSTFLVGDFDNDGLDSFGMYFQATGNAYWKNDLDWNSGILASTQSLGLPLGNAATAATWKGY